MYLLLPKSGEGRLDVVIDEFHITATLHQNNHTWLSDLLLWSSQNLKYEVDKPKRTFIIGSYLI